MFTASQNGHARPVIERGAARHRRRSKSQRAVIAAEILAGQRDYRLNRRELAAILGISVGMIDAARKLPTAARQVIAHGKRTLRHVDRHPRRTMPRASRNGNGASRDRGLVTISDAELWDAEPVVVEAAQ